MGIGGEASAAEPSVHGAEAKLGAGRAPPPRTEREGGWVENESTAAQRFGDESARGLN